MCPGGKYSSQAAALGFMRKSITGLPWINYLGWLPSVAAAPQAV